MAFCKTGVFPFDPTIVTKEMMAPSLETSIRGHLPIMPSTPIRAITDLLYHYNAKQRQERDAREELSSDESDSATEDDSPLRKKSRYTTPV